MSNGKIIREDTLLFFLLNLSEPLNLIVFLRLLISLLFTFIFKVDLSKSATSNIQLIIKPLSFKDLYFLVYLLSFLIKILEDEQSV